MWDFIHTDTATYGAEFTCMKQVIEERNFYDLNSLSATNELILPNDNDSEVDLRHTFVFRDNI